MVLLLLSWLGGVLTILSPCILPVLPFVFARADLPFLRSGLPLLLGMAVTFAGIAMLATFGGGWAVQANSFGRLVALAILAIFGLLLLFPALSERVTRPLVAWVDVCRKMPEARKAGRKASRRHCCLASPRDCCGRLVPGRSSGWC